MRYIDCEKYAQEILEEVKQVKHNKYFAIVSVGDNPASQSYIKGKIKDCETCGIPHIHKHLSAEDGELAQSELKETLYNLRHNYTVSSAILQLPLPEGWDEQVYLEYMSPDKDVDGLTKNSKFSPCTPEGIVYLLKKELGNLEGKTALIIGRGSLVGRPLFDMLLKENCTVTMAHSKTRNLEAMLKSYDIIVVAVGKPKLIDLAKCDAQIVVDVGVNRVDGKLCGDCYNFDAVSNENMLVTPVPKGIGLMTRAMLMKHIAEINKKEV
jgi:methylenetetrahydrofolate dehydrogenase (NADP+)/methenyltetrahydrofolate cyclohydrolase